MGSRENLGCYNWDGSGTTGVWGAEARDNAKYPMM